jgi:trehalose/maltose hydrolase-like predicted phosphorylase
VSRWVLDYEGYDPSHEGTREALCTVGNGYFATRGALPECDHDDVHHPGTYVAGVYNRLEDEVGDRIVSNESLVNAPNWLVLRFRIDDGPWLRPDEVEMEQHRLELDMHRGVLTRRSRLVDPEGRVLVVAQRRFVSMRDPHLAALQTTFLPVGWSGTLEVCSAIDGTVRNDGVARYAGLDDRHLAPVTEAEVDAATVVLVAETTQSRVRLAEAARTRVFRHDEPIEVDRHLERRPGWVGQSFSVDVEDGVELRVEKVVALFTSRDHGVIAPDEEAAQWAADVAGDFDDLLRRHLVSWRHIWERVRIEFGVDGDLARILHLLQFHLLQTVSNNSVPIDVGVPARGLHGEAYRGHIFWDELFILPFLSLRLPQIARATLLYRYRRLDRARQAATAIGCRGAMFPWQSAGNGREETQTMHFNPKSGRWLPDASHLQRHVNVAIVYNVWHYYQATGDLDFLRFFGAEMILEIARFWSSLATYDHVIDRYRIRGVMGPDEYHEGYPDHDEPGLEDNAYTNVMAVWCLMRAIEVLELLPPVSVHELRERLSISEDELARWDEISHRMVVHFHDDVISQFAGYEHLEELDWADYVERYGDIHRLDRILEAEGDTPNRYKVAKQADVMMLFYVLSVGEVAALLTRLGYPWDDDLVARNSVYYEARTVHGSTLSRLVHAWINARLDRRHSWSLFCSAVRSDLDDIQGGTTAEGIHLGAMAGSVDLLQRCYAGIEVRHDVLRFDPAIPEELGSLSFDIRYRGHVVHVELTTETASVRVDLEEGAPITVDIKGVVSEVAPGELIEVPVGPGTNSEAGLEPPEVPATQAGWLTGPKIGERLAPE